MANFKPITDYITHTGQIIRCPSANALVVSKIQLIIVSNAGASYNMQL